MLYFFLLLEVIFLCFSPSINYELETSQKMKVIISIYYKYTTCQMSDEEAALGSLSYFLKVTQLTGV